MTPQELLERRGGRRQQDHDESSLYRILTLAHWCALCGFSLATGRRILKSGQGPKITRLSTRRVGISIAAHREWMDSNTM